MSAKLKSGALFVSLLSLLCFVLNFVTFHNPVSAQETQPSVKEGSSVQKDEKQSCCKTNPGHEHRHGCSAEAEACYHGKACASKPGCGSHSHACYHKKQCGSGHDCKKRSECCDGSRIDNMLDIARCAKKQLLKEKIKAKLETKIGAKLDKVADLLIDTMLEEYKAGCESKERRSALKEKLSEIFSEKSAN